MCDQTKKETKKSFRIFAFRCSTFVKYYIVRNVSDFQIILSFNLFEYCKLIIAI